MEVEASMQKRIWSREAYWYWDVWSAAEWLKLRQSENYFGLVNHLIVVTSLESIPRWDIVAIAVGIIRRHHGRSISAWSNVGDRAMDEKYGGTNFTGLSCKIAEPV